MGSDLIRPSDDSTSPPPVGWGQTSSDRSSGWTFGPATARRGRRTIELCSATQRDDIDSDIDRDIDRGEPAPPDRSRRRPWLTAVAGVNAAAAWAGGIALATGGIDLGGEIDERLPFDSPVLAGLALVLVVAVPLTALTWSSFVDDGPTDELALVAGLALIGWICVQVVVIQTFSWFQPFYLGVGVVLVVASHRVALGPRARGAAVAGLGALVTAIGIGLVPHVTDDTASVAAIVSIVSVVSGIAALVVGTAAALRGRRLPLVIAGVVIALIGTAVVVSVVSPAVAVTNVPPSAITATPADLDLGYDSITLTTSDGVELAAWYLPGSNGAGVVVRHGAGSTRSDVLDRAAVLADAGYGVLLVDARGHGDSGGTAMDFGWYGDLDITAAVDFLAARPEIDDDRIGVVGFSMGGEEAIGAASADDRIRAVVAEGATARRATDKRWLSDAYGWRGRIQEQLEQMQDVVTDYLSEASPPTPLHEAVSSATETRFLLITAGAVADERHAAAFIAHDARDRVAIWTVDDAGHTDGYDTAPDDWQRRVIGFLDETLQ